MPRIRSITAAELSAATRRLSATTRYLYEESALRGTPLVLFFDLDRQEYWVARTEEGSGALVEDTDLLARRVTLPSDVRIADVFVPGTGTFSQGLVPTRFYPEGYADRSVIHLVDDGGHAYTLEIDPVRGRGEVFRGLSRRGSQLAISASRCSRSLVAVAVLATALVSLLSLHARNIRTIAYDLRLARATLLAQDLMTRTLTVDAFPDPARTSGDFASDPDYRLGAEVLLRGPTRELEDQLREIRVRVFWDENDPDAVGWRPSCGGRINERARRPGFTLLEITVTLGDPFRRARHRLRGLLPDDRRQGARRTPRRRVGRRAWRAGAHHARPGERATGHLHGSRASRRPELRADDDDALDFLVPQRGLFLARVHAERGVRRSTTWRSRPSSPADGDDVRGQRPWNRALLRRRDRAAIPRCSPSTARPCSRSAATSFDPDKPNPAASTMILQGVTELDFRFFDGSDWVESWDSTRFSQLRAGPARREIVLSVADRDGKAERYVTSIDVPMSRRSKTLNPSAARCPGREAPSPARGHCACS